MPTWVTSPIHDRAIAALVAAREAAGLTQRDLAERIGRPQSFIAKIETKERNLSLSEFVELVDAIGAAPADLLNSILEANAEQS
jgi:transcriptional regulator with XRE-family HTH domain